MPGPACSSATNADLPPDGTQKYREIANQIGSMLGVQAGPVGRLGCDGLLEAFPSRAEILIFEAALVQDTIKALATSGTTGAQEQLAEKLGFIPEEIVEMILLARSAIGAFRDQLNVEDDRALMELALDDFASRSREALNLSAELQAMKLKALLLGLTRTDPEDEMMESVRIIAKVASEDQKRLTTGDE